jgi:hypothetical protein
MLLQEKLKIEQFLWGKFDKIKKQKKKLLRIHAIFVVLLESPLMNGIFLEVIMENFKLRGGKGGEGILKL